MENGSDGASKTATASAQAKSEIEEYLEVSEQRHKLFPRAVAVGLVAGAVAVLFRALLAGGDALRNGLVNWSHSMPALGWIFFTSLWRRRRSSGSLASTTLCPRDGW